MRTVTEAAGARLAQMSAQQSIPEEIALRFDHEGQGIALRRDSEPTGDVTIGISSSDPSEGTVSTTTLTFTPLNWSTAQTVTVTGVDDAVDDGDLGYTIVTGPATGAP